MEHYGIDVPNFSTFLRTILTDTLVLNTGETGDINYAATLIHQCSFSL